MDWLLKRTFGCDEGDSAWPRVENLLNFKNGIPTNSVPTFAQLDLKHRVALHLRHLLF